VVYSPTSNDVLDFDSQGSRRLHLSVGRSGGSCIVSPVYTLSTHKPLPIGKAPWGIIAHVTPHTTLATEPGQDGDEVAEPAAEANNLEYDSETEFLNREIKPPSPSKPRVIAAAALCLNPRRTLQCLIRILWGSFGYVVRALVMRLFAMIGLPLWPISYLRRTHPKDDCIESQARARMGESKAGSSDATSEKSEGPGGVVSDSTTDVASSVSVRGAKWRPSRVFNIPGGPFSLLAHTEPTTDTDGGEKSRLPLPDVTLDGERMELKITALDHGWTVMQTNGNVNGGRVEIYCTAASTWSARPH